MIKRIKGLFLTAILTVFFIGVTATYAKAETYLAGEFTITLDYGENGKTYRGCDAQGKCINLENGTSWRDNGYRGITWENGDYTYSVSWRENANEGMYLNIYNKDKQILRRQLVETTENVGTLKGVTYCDVVNITSGQLALRDSPNGQSRAGLDNGNNVLLKKQEGIWAYVSVVQGPNTRINGLSGWVNSNYLHCTKEPID
ncbi:hypothetical protein CDG77_10385 [Nostoc sp. 'Peltigera membranacea cyanobiont' 213]|uniref:hypothetical protein n=1 Tax=Nostoc sp. 'Peltigera membranacea cyanobiont' 213 TaxID=2014530 RepID=UPI000B9541E3|nr:hypothetical protein [Nostoc sp. 'Peltigera membranacea cyanobiont' 213]OYD95131.1 hypothetical protein CDG77_10385 [Nostoc sp. 'Peltigera membranacea cyanobiont' 213]